MTIMILPMMRTPTIIISIGSVLLFFQRHVRIAQAGFPSPPLYYDDQLIDHTERHHPHQTNRWTHRYYATSTHFQGPGYPIFLIMGGEEEITPETGIMYPFIANELTQQYGAYVVQPEHRFYGESQPIPNLKFIPDTADITTALMTTEQAMWDAVRLVKYIQVSLGCSADKEDSTYCPVITVGGSYPGFLAAAMRLRHPNVVDMAYAGSAPMKFYSQQVDQYDYYNHITKVADQSSSGCHDAVRFVLIGALGDLVRQVHDKYDLQDLASRLGICDHSIPSYITNVENDVMGAMLYDELVMVVGYTFANYNMGNYPPNNETDLYRACQIFQDDTTEPTDRLAQFLKGVYLNKKDFEGEGDPNENINVNGGGSGGDGDGACLDMSSQLPAGIDATISSGDWSGVGTGRNGQMWDFQTCDLLVEQIGFGPDPNKSMFPFRPWTMEWMDEHCQRRFGIHPDPHYLVKEWGIDDLVKAGASHILFTNGLNDGWSVGGIQDDLSDTILAINFENGAHHSDLSGVGPSERDTPDIKRGFEQISKILGGWLDDIATEAESKKTEEEEEKESQSGMATHHLRKKRLETESRVSVTTKV